MFKFLKGRTNRATYWSAIAIIAGLLVLAAFYAPDLAHVNEVLLVVLCVPRLHDIGRSGWWILAAFGLELCGLVVGFGLFDGETSLQVMGVFTLLMAVLAAVLGAIPGQPGANRFGEPPRAGLALGRSAERA